MRIAGLVEYDGTDFKGWQVQPEGRTIQGEIEKVLAKILQREIRIVGAGRTDAGVHSTGQVFHFDIDDLQMGIWELNRGMNALLPRDIFVHSLLKVDDDFHARFSAVSREYVYRIFLGRSPLRRRFVWEFVHQFDLGRIRQMLPMFLGKRNFLSFTVQDYNGDAMVDLEVIDIKVVSTKEIEFSFKANRFLHSMIRFIVGVLCALARGRVDGDFVRNLLENPRKGSALFKAPPQGLCLVKVNYPKEVFYEDIH